MRILGFIASHYMGSYGKECLLSLRDHCDKVYICHSIGTSQGFPAPSDPLETAYEIRKLAEEVLGDKLIWEEYPGFHTEQDHRNMRYRHTAGYEYCLSADYDEIMADIPRAIKYADHGNERFFGVRGYRHFIHGTEWYQIDSQTPIRLEKLTAPNLDTNNRLPLTVYHMSLAQPIEVMKYKLAVSGHKNEIRPDFLEKWMNWTPESTDMHPTIPGLWGYPQKFEGELPEILKNHKPKEKKMLKLLWIPLDYFRHNDSPELFTDVLNALNLETECRIYSGGLVDYDKFFNPNVILFQGSLTPEELQKLKEDTNALTIMMTGDARYAPMQSLMEYRSVVDSYLVPFSGPLLDTYTTLLGKPCHFLFESIQNWRFKSPKMMDEGPVTFVGHVYGTLPRGKGILETQEFLAMSGLDTHFYGNGFMRGEYPNDLVPELYNDSYIVIAENNHQDIQAYFTPRTLGGIAAGSCTLMKYFPGIEKFFQENVHCFYYKNKFELLQKIEFLKNNPEIRNQIASQGHGLALTNFGLDSWVKNFKNIINKYYLK